MPQKTRTTLGIIGTGHLAGFLVAGLRNSGDNRRIILSPRNAEKAQQLAERYSCEVMATNQVVVDQADILLLSLRPDTALVALSELTLSPGQLIISVVAGHSLEDQIAMAKPATLVRAMVLSCAEYNAGPLILFPEEIRARELLTPLGQLIVLDTEEEFKLAFAPICSNGWLYLLVEAMEKPLLEAGLDSDKARCLVVEAIKGAMAHITANPGMNLQQVTDGIASPETYTKKGLEILDKLDAFSPWEKAVKALIAGKENE